MPNHFHLVMTATRDDGVPTVMKPVRQRYGQHVNRTYPRPGGVFEGRFRLADGARQLSAGQPALPRAALPRQRSIKPDPIRASVVNAPGDSPMSSHWANTLVGQDSVVTRHALHQDLADSHQVRLPGSRRVFEDRLSIALHSPFCECTNGGFVLGSSKFERQIAAICGRRPGRAYRGVRVGKGSGWAKGVYVGENPILST